MTIDEFFKGTDTPDLRTIDRLVNLLWFIGSEDPSLSCETRGLCAVIERNGYPKQNVTRTSESLAKDKRVVRGAANGWRLTRFARQSLDPKFISLVGRPVKPQEADSVLPRGLFVSSRDYIKRVVQQLNASFDYGLYDCCAVMSRRLLETLLIEVYEFQGRAHEIKGADGHFLMFAGLLGFFEKDKQIHPSRNALKGLRGVKDLGDLAAHNRRFNAHQNDIERIRDGLRVAAGELLQMAGLAAMPQEGL